MQVSLDWLRKYAPAAKSAPAVAEVLTNGVGEVDAIRDASVLKMIKVGELRAVEKHPNADSLWVTEVTVGRAMYRIVCGAGNLAVGEKVAVALPGVTLPDGLKIAKRKIRGVVSHGMLCSPKELGIGEDHTGIWLLPADTKSGLTVPNALKGSADSVELDVPANRPDLYGHLGVAREYAALTGTRFVEPKLKHSGRKKTGLRMVKISDRALAQRFTHARLSGLKNRPSPPWLARALQSAGMKPINAIVDITNYVMLETGQPLHAYDSTKLTGTVLFVRRSKPDETLTTLDGKRRSLPTGTPVIADRTQAVGLAGIMGGQPTEVSAGTTEIDLECVSFRPPAIRAASRKLGVRTEASARFEKGLPAELTLPAVRRAIDLIIQICGGQVAQLVDEYPAKSRPVRLRVETDRVNRLLGTDFSGSEIKRALKPFGFTVTGGRQLQVAVPWWRPDVTDPADLAEEVARWSGYDRLPATVPQGELVPAVPPAPRRLTDRLTGLLTAAGYTEVLTHSLVGDDLLDRSGFPTTLVRMANPLSADHAYLRGNLAPRHLEAVTQNLRWRDEVAMFEFGRVFEPKGKRVIEQRKLMVTLAAKPSAELLPRLRGILGLLADRLGIGELEFAAVDLGKFATGRHWQVAADGRRIGWIGEYAHPARFKAGRICFISLNLEYLEETLPSSEAITAPPEFPAVYRDLSVVVPDGTTYADLRDRLRRAAKLPVVVSNPSEYQADGRRSLTVRLAFQATERTLTDKQVGAEMDHLTADLAQAGYKIRD